MNVRIASLSPATTEILFSLGLQKEIVCTDQFSNFPEEARALPHLRDHMNIKPEDLKKFDPEIVFTSTVIQQRLAAELRTAGFTVIHQDPRTLPAVQEAIKQVGMILQCEEQAAALVLRMLQTLNDVKRKAALLPRRCKLYIEEWPSVVPSAVASEAMADKAGAMAGKHDLPFASGNWVPEIAKIAGGEQCIMKPGELSREVTLEQIAACDPDLIVISWCGAGSLADKGLLLKRPGWDQLRAVREGHVRVIDDSLLNRPGPRLQEAAQRLYGWMFEMLH